LPWRRPAPRGLRCHGGGEDKENVRWRRAVLGRESKSRKRHFEEFEDQIMSYEAPFLSLEAARQARAEQIADAERHRIAHLARSTRSRGRKGRSRGRPFVRPHPA
jgi:hypothetical protein